MRWRILSVAVCAYTIMAGVLYASESGTASQVKSGKQIVFPASKGNVHFSHDFHVMVLKNEECIPCHKTNTPSAKDTKSRFDQRVAHYFCRGCHLDKGRGPTECHGCHENKH